MTTLIINTVDAKEQFTDIVNRVAHHQDRIVLTRRGKELAVIISLEDFKLIQSAQDKHDLHEAIEALKDSRQNGAISLEQLKEEIGI